MTIHYVNGKALLIRDGLVRPQSFDIKFESLPRLSGLLGGDDNIQFLSGSQLTNQEIYKLCEVFDCDDVREFCKLCDEINSRTRAVEMPDIPNKDRYRDAA